MLGHKHASMTLDRCGHLHIDDLADLAITDQWCCLTSLGPGLDCEEFTFLKPGDSHARESPTI